MPRRTSLKRKQVIDAVHKGMAKSARRFQRWSKGRELADWGVENLMATYCAEAVAAAAAHEGATFGLTVEEPFGEVLWSSERVNAVGRPTLRAADLTLRPTRRIDLVLWNAKERPRAVIELKRNANTRGLIHDAERVADFVNHAGRVHQGSVSWGLLGVLVHARGADAAGILERKLQLRDDTICAVGRQHGLRVDVTIRRIRRSSQDARPGALATMVFKFHPKGG